MKNIILILLCFGAEIGTAQDCITSKKQAEFVFNLKKITQNYFRFSPIEENKIWCSTSDGGMEIDTKTGIIMPIWKKFKSQKFRLEGITSFRDTIENYYWIVSKDSICRYSIPGLSVQRFKNKSNITSITQTQKFIYFASQEQILIYNEKKVLLKYYLMLLILQ
jgi:hypothetical protein